MNIIPDTARLEASVRVLSKKSTEQVAADLPKLAENIAAAHGCTAEATLEVLYPVTANDPDEAAYVIDELTTLYGAERVEIMDEPLMGSEDFSFVLDQVPGAYIFLGAHPDPVSDPLTNHSARAFFDDAILADASATLAHLAYTKITRLAAG
jgi:hippurate hydrolase